MWPLDHGSTLALSSHPLARYIEQLEAGGTLLQDSADNVLEVVGILKSYGVVLDAYAINLCYSANHQFLVLFPFFKYLNGEVTWAKWLRYMWHDRINYEYAEYCAKTMFWHGGGGLDTYVDSPPFQAAVEALIQAKLRSNPLMQLLHRLFPDFLPEQMRQMAYFSGLGQFWQVMSDMFLDLSDRYDRGEITAISQVVQHIQDGLVAAASRPITYQVQVGEEEFVLIPEAAGLTFLADTAIPYVEAVFFRGTPFLGTVSFNAQAYQISYDQSQFEYGALYADPLPVGGAGIPPTLLMQDMRHFLPNYLRQVYLSTPRGEGDLLVKICESFQKSMFCVTSATIRGLAPYPLPTSDPKQQQANRQYLESWMDRFGRSRLQQVNS
ncbi:MAG: CO2 hydration protein [Chloroflexaceae bacterium]|nr:CO2 hydration protein [Chloroflexaceae bacterium]